MKLFPLHLIPNDTNIDFMRWRKVTLSLALLAFVASLAIIGLKGFNYALEFTGGTVVEARFDKSLDVDAVRTVSEGVRLFRERTHGSLLIITHSTRILEALHVDAAHVMEDGVIVRNGGAELVDEINEKGFSSLKED